MMFFNLKNEFFFIKTEMLSGIILWYKNIQCIIKRISLKGMDTDAF